MELTFPPGWQVTTYPMRGHAAPALTDDQIREALRNAVGTRRLADVADGKRTAVITFDDMTRPTPAFRVVPFVLEELHAAGIRDDDIIFQSSCGTHAPMTQPEMEGKLGRQIVQNYMVWNHDCFDGLTAIGTTSRRNEVRVNNRFAAADVKISISGVKPHGIAGYGGGAKAVLPGVASLDCIRYNHGEISDAANPRTTKGFLNNDCRLDMEEAARMAGLDMSINVAMNGSREISAMTAGDVVEGHRAAVRIAHELYETTLAEEPDVVICNAYPQANEASKELHFARRSLRDGGSAVLIQDTARRPAEDPLPGLAPH